MKNTHEPRRLWNGAAYGTPYQHSGAKLAERLDGASLAAAAHATGRTIIGMLNNNGFHTLQNLGKPA